MRSGLEGVFEDFWYIHKGISISPACFSDFSQWLMLLNHLHEYIWAMPLSIVYGKTRLVAEGEVGESNTSPMLVSYRYPFWKRILRTSASSERKGERWPTMSFFGIPHLDSHSLAPTICFVFSSKDIRCKSLWSSVCSAISCPIFQRALTYLQSERLEVE